MTNYKKSEMPLFIQGMYATVLGVSFYKIALLNSDTWKPVENLKEFFAFFDPTTFWAFLKSEYFFRFFLFAGMLLIIAHDWFSYHLEKRNNDDANYWHYAPQLFALFFLAQMFGAIEILNLKYWYAFAFWYTVSNILNVRAIYSPQDRPHKIKKYCIHVLLTVVGFFIVPDKFKYPTYHITFGLTFLFVTLLWKWKAKAASQTKSSADEIEKAISTAESNARNARRNYLSEIKTAITDTKITETEGNILTAEENAKKERINLKKQLEEAKTKISNLESQLNEQKEKK